MYHSLGTPAPQCRIKSIWAPTSLPLQKYLGTHCIVSRIKSIWALTALSHQKHLGTHYIVASKLFEGHPLHCRIKNIRAPTAAVVASKYLGTHCIVTSKAFGHPLHCRIKIHGRIWTPIASVVASKATVFGHPLHHWVVASKATVFGHPLHCRIKSIRTPTALSHQKPRYLDTHCGIVASKVFGHPLNTTFLMNKYIVLLINNYHTLYKKSSNVNQSLLQICKDKA